MGTRKNPIESWCWYRQKGGGILSIDHIGACTYVCLFLNIPTFLPTILNMVLAKSKSEYHRCICIIYHAEQVSMQCGWLV